MAQFYSAKRRVTTRQIITFTLKSMTSIHLVRGVARHNRGKGAVYPRFVPEESAEVG